MTAGGDDKTPIAKLLAANRRALAPAAAVGLATLLVGAASFYWGVDGLFERALELRAEVRARPLISAAALFAWSFILFMTVLPLGTVTIITAGALLGPWVGWVQFLSLALSSQIIFETGDQGARLRSLKQVQKRRRLWAFVQTLRERGFAVTSVLRLAPVVPSAVCALACAGLGVTREKFIAGTLLAGWVRPVIFGLIGAATELDALRDMIDNLWLSK